MTEAATTGRAASGARVPVPHARTRVVHLITGTGLGGAESTLYALLRGTQDDFEHAVISMLPPGEVAAKIEALGIRVHTLGMRRGRGALGALPALVKLLRQLGPDVVQAWMYHANLLAAAAKPFGSWRLAWNLRRGRLDPATDSRQTLLVARAGAWMSRRVPDAVVACSEATQQSHAALGYAAANMRVIANGVDVTRFAPAPGDRLRMRAELGLDPDTVVAGVVARFHPQKGHAQLVDAARRLRDSHPALRFVCCGTGVDRDNRALVEMLDDAGVSDRFVLLGPRLDLPTLLPAFDFLVSPSLVEGFPNAVAESMAAGLPCVVTDVGDSREIAGDTGYVVPPDDAAALAAAIARMAALSPEARAALGERARERVRSGFTIAAAHDRYRALYRELAAGRLRS